MMRSSFLPCFTILLAVTLPRCSSGVNARLTDMEIYRKLFLFSRSKTPDCYYSGYKPGGGIPNIKPIQSPVAKAQKNMLAYIVGKLKAHSYAAKELTYGAKVFLHLFENVGPKLASSLGVFCGAMGVLETFTKPTPEDIMKGVNKALKQLTEDVNNRLRKMEGYVDGRVIQLEKRLMNVEYKVLYNYWVDCIKQRDQDAGLDCQRHSNRLISTHLPHFQVLGEMFTANQNVAPSYYDINRLEAGLVPFRDYAALHIYTLQVLADSLNNTMYDHTGFYRKKFTAELAKVAMTYYKYSHWAYKWIIKQQVEVNGYQVNQGNPRYGKKTKVVEGFGVGVHTADYQDIFPQCTNDTKADIYGCKIHLTVRVDGKLPWEHYYGMTLPGVKQYDFDSALINHGKTLSKHICEDYLQGLSQDIKTYWHTELLDVAEGWKEAAIKAEEDLKGL